MKKIFNNNYKIPIDCKIRKLEVHLGCTANFDNSRSLDLKAVDTVGIPVDSRFDCRIGYLEIAVEIDRDRLDHCCIDRKIAS